MATTAFDQVVSTGGNINIPCQPVTCREATKRNRPPCAHVSLRARFPDTQPRPSQRWRLISSSFSRAQTTAGAIHPSLGCLKHRDTFTYAAFRPQLWQVTSSSSSGSTTAAAIPESQLREAPPW
ncbi:unnamed protein product [Ectocarpus sp. 4 AP-2014]